MVTPRRAIRIAAQLHPQHGRYAQLRRAAVTADELGFDIIYNWDHFFPLYGDRNGYHFECLTTLASFGEVTERAEIGPLVVCNSYRNPHLLADMARTIDHISGGRFILGVGSGWYGRDYDEYGYEFGTARSRLHHLADNLPLMRHRLGALNPPPVGDMPLLIAGTGPKVTLPLVAEYAQIWHARFPHHADDHRAVVENLTDSCSNVGRDPAEIEWAVGVQPEDRERFLAEEAEALVEMGFTQFTLGFNGPDWPLNQARDWLAWRDEVNTRG